MLTPQLRLTALDQKIIVDLFAGGGGISVAMEMAWGRSPDIAINHNEDALSLHQANHPQTEHYVADVFEVCPKKATRGRPVGWLHLSPDCTHFSQARGGQPRSSKIRALAWVGIRWAGQVRPDWISLENVKQFTKWGPLVAKRCPKTGRVIRLDGTVAAPGERTPLQEQFLVPDPRREGQTYRRWCAILRGMGYALDSRNIVAADQGGHTTRERHFELGNCIGEPIRWAEPTHHKKPQRGQRKWKPAADCIDWSIPCPSIFERKRRWLTPHCAELRAASTGTCWNPATRSSCRSQIGPGMPPDPQWIRSRPSQHGPAEASTHWWLPPWSRQHTATDSPDGRNAGEAVRET